jgi:glycosyltransferase involved in cell wall biosynthesis
VAHKILFIHHGGAIGGAPVSMLQLAAGLRRADCAPLAIFTQPGPMLRFAADLGVPARVVPLHGVLFQSAHVQPRPRMLARFLVSLWPTIRRAQALVREVRPDLVHLNTGVLIGAAIGIRREGVPLVWHVREVVNTGSPVGRWQAAWITRLADCIVATSGTVAGGFAVSGRVVTVHNAVDLALFDERARDRGATLRASWRVPPGAPTVGIIGAIQRVKGHYTLAAAARRVIEAVPDAVFVAVGVPERDTGLLPRPVARWRGARGRMRRHLATTGLAPAFRMVGPTADIAAAIAAMDVLVFPSLAPEGFGRPLIEAMAMQRPVVASDIGPSREILGEAAGLLVPPGDPEALAAALVRLLRDPGERARLGRAGRGRVEARFALDRHVAAIGHVYGQVLRDGVRAGH